MTSAILNQMLTDVDSIRHGTLQNRAGIDLLLAHKRACEEFEGMCCMNLSDHSASIHRKLKQLQDNMKKLTGNEWGLDEWFEGWGITGWFKDIVKGALLLLVVIIVLLCVIPCMMKLVSLLEENMVERVWLVQEEEGRIVAMYLNHLDYSVHQPSSLELFLSEFSQAPLEFIKVTKT